MTREVFRAAGVTKRFGRKTVLDQLSLELVPGEVTILLGRNGAGKSTLMRLALGTLKADHGTLCVAGHDPLREPRALREQVGYVPSVPDAYPWMTLDDLFRFLAPQYPTWDHRAAAELADSFQIARDVRFRDLSRGEGMKAMLAAALAPHPGLLLLDEPFSGLDAIAREELLRGVIAELRDDRRTVLCATHDLEIAARIADHVAVLDQGRITEHGPLDQVLARRAAPANVVAQMQELLISSTS